MAPRRTIILNPFARSAKAGRLAEELSRLDPVAVVRVTEGLGTATQHAAEAVRDGSAVVVVAGGDGTINEVVNGIMGTDGVLGVLPVGTMNVLARELRLPLSVAGAWRVIEEGFVRTVDVGRIDYGRDGAKCSRYFVQLAGIGLDARIVQRVTPGSKKRWGPFSYVFETVKSVAEPLPRISVRIDGAAPVEASFVLIGNGAYYGGPIPVFQKASMVDGLLDVCLFQSSGYVDLLRYLQAVFRGRHLQARGVTYCQGSSLEIEAAAPVPIEVDGEFVGHLPARMTVVPSALKVLVPSPGRRGGAG